MIDKIKNQNNSQIVAFLNTYESFQKLLVLLMKQRQNLFNDKSFCYNFFIAFDLFVKQLKKNLNYLNGKMCKIEQNLKEFDDTLVLLGCYIILFASTTCNFDDKTIYKIKSIIYELLKLNLKCFISGYTILHLTLATKLDSLSNRNYNFDVVKLLLECGASALELDSCKNTAMHIVMALSDISQNERLQIIKLLLEYGAHLDAKNDQNQFPSDFLEEEFNICSLYSSINPLKFLSLKCFAAQAIHKYNIKYKGTIPTSLEDFLSIH